MVESGHSEGHEGGNTEKQGKYTYLILGGIVAYLVLLVIGVVAEVFNIQSILDWWIWRPPGVR